SGKVPNISHLKPFGCLVTILNTSDHLGKFKGKADEGFIIVAANCCGQVLKIHTDENVADLLTKAFDGPRFLHLVVHIGMIDAMVKGRI
ncbi:hypothetical protein Tco_0081011, partial [Tanacetum coccineum]